MEVFLFEMVIGHEEFFLPRFTAVSVRSEISYIILQHCFDPLYLDKAIYPVALEYEIITATANIVRLELLQVRVA